MQSSVAGSFSDYRREKPNIFQITSKKGNNQLDPRGISGVNRSDCSVFRLRRMTGGKDESAAFRFPVSSTASSNRTPTRGNTAPPDLCLSSGQESTESEISFQKAKRTLGDLKLELHEWRHDGRCGKGMTCTEEEAAICSMDWYRISMGSDCKTANNENVYIEKGGKQALIFNLRSSADAKQIHEEFVKCLIYKGSSHLKGENT